jgi:two-component system, OmpR family, sensor histidine kinase BaeS
MTEIPPGGPAPPRRDTLAPRLAVAFLGVALAAIVLLALLAAVFIDEDVSSQASHQRAELAGAISVGVGTAWDRTDNWVSTDLDPVMEMARKAGVKLQVHDSTGSTVASSPGLVIVAVAQDTVPVVVGGQRIGVVLMWFSSGGLGSESALGAAVVGAIATAAALASGLALLTGFGVARRITGPVTRLIAVTRAMADGDRAARVGDIRAPGELRELAKAFDQMADALDREDQIRRDLVAAVAHELRTPVAVLQAGHEALLDGLAAPTPEEFSSLREEVQRLAWLIDELQTLVAADAATLHLDRRRCDLAEIADDAAGSMARKFEAAGIKLDRRLDGVPVVADEHWLHQVITNLLTNALKFTPAGGTVTVSTRQAGTDAVLEVEDTGIGIPAEELPRVFDRFWRGRGAAQISGSGIGLAIADELARAHGGRLTAVSTEDRGTTMTLTLPRA